RRAGRPRAAWQVGVFLVEARRRGEAGERRRPEGGVVLVATTTGELRDEVRRRYAESARAVTDGSAGCGCGEGACCDDSTASAVGSGKFGEVLYDAEQRGELPDTAVLASLVRASAFAVAALHEAETVLDVGSGGVIDVIVSARRVGPTGIAYGLDMTDEM